MIHANEKEYELRYDFNAYCEYEERFKSSIVLDLPKKGFAVLRAMVWAGLIAKYKMSLREAGDLIENAVDSGMTADAIRLEIVKAVNESNFMRRLSETAAEEEAKRKLQTEKAQEKEFKS